MKPMLVIDRFEGEYAVVETEPGKTCDIPRALFPLCAKEGDVVLPRADGRYEVDAEQTRQRREKIQKRMNGLFR